MLGRSIPVLSVLVTYEVVEHLLEKGDGESFLVRSVYVLALWTRLSICWLMFSLKVKVTPTMLFEESPVSYDSVPASWYNKGLDFFGSKLYLPTGTPVWYSINKYLFVLVLSMRKLGWIVGSSAYATASGICWSISSKTFAHWMVL